LVESIPCSEEAGGFAVMGVRGGSRVELARERKESRDDMVKCKEREQERSSEGNDRWSSRCKRGAKMMNKVERDRAKSLLYVNQSGSEDARIITPCHLSHAVSTINAEWIDIERA
jgi:hypothetical protein